ncbi:DUF1800 domain-containing protein [Roseococcus sp.]|uniref:DUF1800 domain-containing protein n=1 Tax=Roseococcus sp. TaxID=2109646 RepID=UPI003BAB1A2A
MDRSSPLTALQRFGFGAAPGELPAVGRDPRAYLAQQLATARASTGQVPARPPLPDTAQGVTLLVDRRTALAERNAAVTRGETVPEPSFVRPGAIILRELSAAAGEASGTTHPLLERLALYWSDHFTTAGAFIGFLGGGMERDAIRPNMLRPFGELLTATTLHPAMLFYLDNQTSRGPDSPSARGSRGRRGLNENLAREVLELHTLGADGGYSQDDVIALARVLTGWSVDLGQPPGRPERVGFIPEFHEPGPKTILGKTYSEDGAGQAPAVLRDLALHPATARNVTRRLVRHFVGHGFPGLEARMAAAFQRSGGDLEAVTRALIADDQAWGPPLKVRPPVEFVFSAARLLGGLPPQPSLVNALRAMGQPFWAAPSPKGWPSENDAWAAPDAIKTRLDWAAEVATRVGAGVDARGLLDAAFGPAASAETRQAVARASDGRQALILLLMSPEFQRR